MSAISRFTLVVAVAVTTAVAFASNTLVGTWRGTAILDRGAAHSPAQGTMTREEQAMLRAVHITLKLMSSGQFEIRMTHLPGPTPNQSITGTWSRSGDSLNLHATMHNGVLMPHASDLGAEISGNDHIIKIPMETTPPAWFEFRK